MKRLAILFVLMLSSTVCAQNPALSTNSGSLRGRQAAHQALRANMRGVDRATADSCTVSWMSEVKLEPVDLYMVKRAKIRTRQPYKVIVMRKKDEKITRVTFNSKENKAVAVKELERWQKVLLAKRHK